MPSIICITGAGSGLGKYLATRFAARGNHLILVDLVRESIDSSQLASLGCEVTIVEADICNSQHLNTAFSKLSIPRIDVLIHCAGILVSKPFEQINHSEYRRCIEVNVIGTRNIVAAALPKLPSAKVYLTASMAGFTGVYGYSAYGASKHAVIGLARSLRVELASQNIRVGLICPPTIDTPMVRRESESIHPATKTMKDIAGNLPLNYAGDYIFNQINAGKSLIIPGIKAKIVYWLEKLTPSVIIDSISLRLIKRSIEKRP